ncbi:(2Fe-2S) ferredoxin domain-containing protein [Blastopirellula marina]|uniref:Ferredoxin n=1 Tax=Blastopirellula marina TaxID=124 RepID=A0A2S8FF86_9BACT|nr:(2Fe-2S) ferredoxin domain-containing protein [Blastopirellula marina]PQO30826.1 ferredoxin [Blastopirellula marina]PTL42679.1 (2Fe-2S) ferredoxin domain-containing protein [Blastopirellula marina]
MPAFTHHIFICENRRDAGHPRGSCDALGGGELRDAFKKELKRHGVKGEVRANSAGCLDQCECGPVIVIYPQAIWYGAVTAQDVPRIVEETVVHGRVLDDLRIPDEALNTKGKVPFSRTSCGGCDSAQGTSE